MEYHYHHRKALTLIDRLKDEVEKYEQRIHKLEAGIETLCKICRRHNIDLQQEDFDMPEIDL